MKFPFLYLFFFYILFLWLVVLSLRKISHLSLHLLAPQHGAADSISPNKAGFPLLSIPYNESEKDTKLLPHLASLQRAL